MKHKILCEYLGGSHSYGLNTPASDTDYRGVYIVDSLDKIINPHSYIDSGCSVYDSNPESSGIDKVYFEVRHFLHLLKKGNTQSIEMLFNNKWTKVSPLFTDIQDKKHSLLDPNKVNVSIMGYAMSEYHLAIGSRTGKLGGKRQSQVEKYGFSPKNFVNLFRLLYSAEQFYSTGQFPVNLSNTYIHPQLMEIKCNPERFTIARLNEMHIERTKAHADSWEKHKDTITKQYKYDPNIAAELMLACYTDQILEMGRIGWAQQLVSIFK
jgi:predicted nucleotidyltransferase